MSLEEARKLVNKPGDNLERLVIPVNRMIECYESKEILTTIALLSTKAKQVSYIENLDTDNGTMVI